MPPIEESEFYIIWIPWKGAPTQKIYSFASAKKEAMRLALKENTEAIILRSLKSYRVGWLVETNFRDPNKIKSS